MTMTTICSCSYSTKLRYSSDLWIGKDGLYPRPRRFAQFPRRACRLRHTVPPWNYLHAHAILHFCRIPHTPVCLSIRFESTRAIVQTTRSKIRQGTYDQDQPLAWALPFSDTGHWRRGATSNRYSSSCAYHTWHTRTYVHNPSDGAGGGWKYLRKKCFACLLWASLNMPEGGVSIVLQCDHARSPTLRSYVPLRPIYHFVGSQYHHVPLESFSHHPLVGPLLTGNRPFAKLETFVVHSQPALSSTVCLSNPFRSRLGRSCISTLSAYMYHFDRVH